MTEMHKKVYAKRGEILVKNLKKRHFDAYYCDNNAQREKTACRQGLLPAGVHFNVLLFQTAGSG